jgi:hypothetical protein
VPVNLLEAVVLGERGLIVDPGDESSRMVRPPRSHWCGRRHRREIQPFERFRA